MSANEITVSEAKQRLKVTERAIVDWLNGFTEETGLKVNALHFAAINTVGTGCWDGRCYSVELEVTL